MAGHPDRAQPADLRHRRAARRFHPFSSVRSAPGSGGPGRDGDGVLPDRAARFPPGLKETRVAQHGLIRDALGALPILGLLAAVYLLPPDTPLSEVRHARALHACMPPVDPPYVTDDTKAPGIDVEILQALGRDLDLKLAPVPEPAMR